MSKYPVLIFLLSFMTSFSFINCMLSELKYKPCIQPLDDEIMDKRNLITLWLSNPTLMKTTNITRTINFVKNATEQEQKWLCFGYAMHKATGSSTSLHIYTDKTLTIDIEKFFTQTKHPQKNDLVIYTTNKDNREIKHFATVINNKIFESKWGSCPIIIQHRLFDIPNVYGNAASFWTLKEKFTTLERKTILLETIKNDADHSSNVYYYKTIMCSILTLSTIGLILSSPVLLFIHFG